MKITEQLKYLVYISLRLLFYVCRIFPTKKNKIVFNAYGGKGFCDNPKYIALNLLNRGNCNFDLVWIVNDMDTYMPLGIRKVKRHSIREIYELATAKIWVDNSRISLYAVKRKNQIYIETWHGCIGLKKVGKVAETKSLIGSKRVEHDTKLTDLMISNSTFTDRLYREDFQYTGEILRCGSPRIDFLVSFDELQKQTLLKRIGLDSDFKYVLYAPTFRDNGREDVYDINLEDVLDALENRFDGKWKVLIKLHPNMTNRQKIFKYTDNVLNFSNYNDIYELLAVSEVLITDYSSLLFEMGLTYKPVFLYAKDIQEMSRDRGLYFELNSLPFKYAATNKALIEIIQTFSFDNYVRNIDSFNDTYLGAKEPGNASQVVADYIIRRAGEIR